MLGEIVLVAGEGGAVATYVGLIVSSESVGDSVGSAEGALVGFLLGL